MHSIDAIKSVPIIGEKNNNIERISRKIAKLYNKSYIFENMKLDSDLGFNFDLNQVKEISSKKKYYNEKEQVLVVEYKKNTHFIIPSIYISKQTKSKYFYDEPDLLNENFLNETVNVKQKISKGKILEESNEEVFDISSIKKLTEAFSLDSDTEFLEFLNEGNQLNEGRIIDWFKNILGVRKTEQEEIRSPSKNPEQDKENVEADKMIAGMGGDLTRSKTAIDKGRSEEDPDKKDKKSRNKFIQKNGDIDYQYIASVYVQEFSKLFTTESIADSETQKSTNKKPDSVKNVLNGLGFLQNIEEFLKSGDESKVEECFNLLWEQVSGKNLGTSEVGQDVAAVIAKKLEDSSKTNYIPAVGIGDKQLFDNIIELYTSRLSEPFEDYDDWQDRVKYKEIQTRYSEIFPKEFEYFQKARQKVINAHRGKLDQQMEGSFLDKAKKAFGWFINSCKKMFTIQYWVGFSIVGLSNMPFLDWFTACARILRYSVSVIVKKCIIAFELLRGYKISLNWDLVVKDGLPKHALTEFLVRNKEGVLVPNPNLKGQQLSDYQELIGTLAQEKLADEGFTGDEITFLREVIGKPDAYSAEETEAMAKQLTGFGDKYQNFCDKYNIETSGNTAGSWWEWSNKKLMDAAGQSAIEGAESFNTVQEGMEKFFDFENFGETLNESLVDFFGFEGGQTYSTIIGVLLFLKYRNAVSYFFVSTWEMSVVSLYKGLKTILGSFPIFNILEKKLNISRFIGIKNLSTHISYLNNLDSSVNANQVVSDILSNSDFGIDTKLQKMTACIMMKNVSEKMLRKVKGSSKTFDPTNPEHIDLEENIQTFGNTFDRYLAIKLGEQQSELEQDIDRNQESQEEALQVFTDQAENLLDSLNSLQEEAEKVEAQEITQTGSQHRFKERR